jgi:hypothetical protein
MKQNPERIFRKMMRDEMPRIKRSVDDQDNDKKEYPAQRSLAASELHLQNDIPPALG